MGQKLWHFFEMTDGWTHRQKRITSVQLQNIFLLHICEEEGGKLYKPYQISTYLLCEGLKNLQIIPHKVKR